MVNVNRRNGLFGNIRADDDLTAAEDQSTDYSAGLASLGYVRGAVRRGVWLWGALALVGLLLGAGLYLKSPPTYQASTTLVLNVGPESVPGTAIANDQVVAQSPPVAALALKDLKLSEDVDSFLQSYTVTVVTDQVLRITTEAPSSGEAVTRAQALAQAFLQFRANELKSQQANYFKALDQALTQQKQTITTLNSEIRQARAAPSEQARVKSLLTQRNNAVATLATLVQQFNNEKASAEETTTQEISKSHVIDTAPVSQSRHGRLKHLIIDVLLGLIGGLTVGLGIVIVRGLVSDRLRRRDDVAYALGAPVKLSLGRVNAKRGLASAQEPDIQRIAAHLRRAVPQSSHGAATLAIVPVDSTDAAVHSIISLALSAAEHGERVVLADLMPGSPAASLLDSAEPGVRLVSVDGAKLVVAIPGPGEDLPTGPLDGASRQAQPALAKAADSANLLLTLVALDPSTGGDHLATWATDAVVIVTAGRSSWTKIHAAGEMIRLSGTRMVSAVLVGADKADESLGMINTPGPGRETGPSDNGLRSNADGALAPVESADVEEGRAPGDPHLSARRAAARPSRAP